MKICQRMKDSGAAVFYIAAVAVVSLLLMWARSEMGLVAGYELQAVVYSVFEALVLTLPYILLPPRWRGFFWLPLLAVLLLLYINVLFFRYTGDMISGSMYSVSSVNMFAVAGAVNAMRMQDFVAFLAIGLLAVAFYLLRKYIFSERFGIKGKVVFTAILIALCAAAWGVNSYRLRTDLSDIYKEKGLLRTFQIDWQWKFGNNQRFRDHTLFGYAYRQLRNKYHTYRALTSKERMDVEQFLGSKQAVRLQPGDSGQRNLIVIFVESMNSTIFDLPCSRQIAPFCVSLLEDSTVFSARKVLQQARGGRSSDGQLIVNTGLLPLKEGTFAYTYADSRLPGLPRILDGYRSVELTGDPRRIWNHGLTSVSFGFDELVDDLAEYDKTILNLALDQDSVIFELAAEMASTMPTPFYMQICTIAMHDPYTEPKARDSKCLRGGVLSDMDERDRNYLVAVAHFDESLQCFVERLKVCGLYDNSLIVITGDHEAYHNCLSPLLQTDYVPLIILNSGIGKHIEQPVEQIDIFPTILDMMGVDCYIPEGKTFAYRGVGTSLLCDSVPAAGEKEWAVSDMIIRSRFFN